jgi:pyrimidine operon attenuation protein/uracil phosphoribosyltransferase
MGLHIKEQLLNAEQLDQVLQSMTEAIAGSEMDFSNVAFLGVVTHGATLADRLAKKLTERLKRSFLVSYVDITLYRDDRLDSPHDPFERKFEIPFSVANRELILVDDVLFTGRTVRAAISSILDRGRPKRIKVAALVDRGHRELPIFAEYVGLHVDTALDEGIRLYLGHPDHADGLYRVAEGDD